MRRQGKAHIVGMIAEVCSVVAFHTSDALAKYADLTWRRNNSGNFEAVAPSVTKAGNGYLRYYLCEMANIDKRYIPQCQDFYASKYAEVPKYRHKKTRAYIL